MNHWQVLNLQKGCSLDEIIKAYRIAAMKTHPDRGGSVKEFVKVKEAYEWLLDNYDVKPESILKSSLDDFRDISSQSDINTSWKKWKSSLDDYDVGSYMGQEVELEINDQKAFNSGNGFSGEEANGVIRYKLSIQQLINGCNLILRIPCYQDFNFNLPQDTIPGTIHVVTLTSTRIWSKGVKKDCKIKFLLEDSCPFNFVDKNLIFTHKCTLSDVISRKAFFIPDPKSTGLRKVIMPEKISNSSVIKIPHAGFSANDLYITLDYDIPKS